jgi:hypothetical protein
MANSDAHACKNVPNLGELRIIMHVHRVRPILPPESLGTQLHTTYSPVDYIIRHTTISTFCATQTCIYIY